MLLNDSRGLFMKKEKTIYVLTFLVGLCMFSIGLYIKSDMKTENIQIKEIEEIDIKNMAASASMILTDSEKEQSPESVSLLSEVEMEVAPSAIKKTPMQTYEEMSIQDREAALYAGTLPMEYSGFYTYSGDRLTMSKGAQYYNGHKETYYSERVLPGTSLNIPGRYVADDGTVRDGDGFICVAADPGYMGRGSVLITSLGPAKVYDSGCAYGTIDIYVNW